jgi:hypothetical protein
VAFVSPCEVICIERDSYISAVVALQILIEMSPEGSESKRQYADALADFRRAHAMYLAVDAQITTPALLRRQI